MKSGRRLPRFSDYSATKDGKVYSHKRSKTLRLRPNLVGGIDYYSLYINGVQHKMAISTIIEMAYGVPRKQVRKEQKMHPDKLRIAELDTKLSQADLVTEILHARLEEEKDAHARKVSELASRIHKLDRQLLWSFATAVVAVIAFVSAMTLFS